MSKKIILLAVMMVAGLGLLCIEVSAENSNRAGNKIQARDGRGDQAGQGKGSGQYRKGSGKGRGWHRDGTGRRSGSRVRNRENCIDN